MATRCAAVLHRPQLHSATLASLVHGHLHQLDTLDRHLLLPDGVDGKRAGVIASVWSRFPMSKPADKQYRERVSAI